MALLEAFRISLPSVAHRARDRPLADWPVQLACAKLWRLSQDELVGDKLIEAQHLQGVIARADFWASNAGVSQCEAREEEVS